VVKGVDIAPNLLEQARQRAAAEGLQATFDEGDAEQLPYPDAQFDLVMSMFGAMFAPRPDVTARELIRVLRPGGTLAMANWTPTGFAGQTFQLTARYAPPPPGVPPPALWGDDKVVRERLSDGMSKVETTRRTAVMRFPFPPAECVHFFREYFGPTKTLFARLDEAQQKAYAADFERMFAETNQSGNNDETVIENEYLEVIATKA
jgi:SAM-dependent methyltransferase